MNKMRSVARTGFRRQHAPSAPASQRGRIHRCRADKLDYKSAGVDIDAGNELVRRIKKLNPEIGGFSGLFPFGTILNYFN
jgi:hypothetical protein